MARTFRPKKGATLIMLLALSVLIALGTWQVKRLHWKNALVAGIETQMAQAPAALPQEIPDPVALEYRPVSVTGNFMHDYEVLIRPRTRDGVVGYHLVTPLREAAGRVVLVNRGFVTDDTLAAAVRPDGEVTVSGHVSLPHKSKFTPDNDPAKNSWYWIDIPGLKQALALGDVAPVIVEVQDMRDGSNPAGVPAALDIPNDHLQYAFFWFSMAFILLLIWFIYHWREEH